jgi:hypothetical protein
MEADKKSKEPLDTTVGSYANDIYSLKKRLETLENMKKDTENLLKDPRYKSNNISVPEIYEDDLKLFENKIVTLKTKLSNIEKNNSTVQSEPDSAVAETKPTDIVQNKINIINVAVPEIKTDGVIQYAATNNMRIEAVAQSDKFATAKNPKKTMKLAQTQKVIKDIDLSDSIRSLNKTVEDLLKLFGSYGDIISDDYDGIIAVKLDALIEQNNVIINQNERILYNLSFSQNITEPNIIQEDPKIDQNEPVQYEAESSENTISSFDILKRGLADKAKMDIAKLPLAAAIEGTTDESERKKVSHRQIRDIFGMEKRKPNSYMEKNKSPDDYDYSSDAIETSIKIGAPPQAHMPLNLDLELPDDDAQPLKMNTAPKPPSSFFNEKRADKRN